MAIAIIWSDEHPTAARFYKFAPVEAIAPSGVLKIKKRYTIERMTAMKLFAKMTKYAKKGGEVLIVSHGVPTGPAIPLVTELDPEAGVFPPALQLNAIAEIEALEDGSQDEAATATNLDMTLDQLRAFREKLKEVRKLKLKRIEFRACDISAQALEKLRDFLGAEVVGAPIHKDSYTPNIGLPSGFTEDYFASWKDEHPDAVIDATPHGDFGYWHSEIDEDTVEFEFHWSAESKKAYKHWVDERFPSAKDPTKGAVFHGFAVDKKLKFIAPDTYRDFLAST